MGRCYNTTTINAPVDKIWAAIRNFHDMSWAGDTLESVEPVGDKKGDQIGARRALNGAIQETLVALNDRDHTMSYQITDGPSPISKSDIRDYYGEVQLLPVTADGSTFVEWSSSWIGNDGPVAEFCNPIYAALLAAMKRSLE